jgi:predicted secreted protein
LTSSSLYDTIGYRKGDKTMTKKQIKEKNKKNRVMVNFNTGTRTFKSAKDYSRKDGKEICRKALTSC